MHGASFPSSLIDQMNFSGQLLTNTALYQLIIDQQILSGQSACDIRTTAESAGSQQYHLAALPTQ
jgi:hypothetical protein